MLLDDQRVRFDCNGVKEDDKDSRWITGKACWDLDSLLGALDEESIFSWRQSQ